MVSGVQSGHPGGSLGCVEFFVALYGNVMLIPPSPSKWRAKTRICSSRLNGPAIPGLVQRAGPDDIFRRPNWPLSARSTHGLQGHPTTHEGSARHPCCFRLAGPGGFAYVTGLAPPTDYRAMAAGIRAHRRLPNWMKATAGKPSCPLAHHKVDNLIVTVDWNPADRRPHQRGDGPGQPAPPSGSFRLGRAGA